MYHVRNEPCMGTMLMWLTWTLLQEASMLFSPSEDQKHPWLLSVVLSWSELQGKCGRHEITIKLHILKLSVLLSATAEGGKIALEK